MMDAITVAHDGDIQTPNPLRMAGAGHGHGGPNSQRPGEHPSRPRRDMS